MFEPNEKSNGVDHLSFKTFPPPPVFSTIDERIVRRVNYFLPFEYRKTEKYQKIHVPLTIFVRNSLKFRLLVVIFNVFVRVEDNDESDSKRTD